MQSLLAYWEGEFDWRGCGRALVTSRFPLVDLEGWTGAGHRAIMLDDLERSVAVRVKADDEPARRIEESRRQLERIE